MKNNKATIYILLFFCIVIWGTISWKVYQAFQKDIPVITSRSPQNVVKEEKDTTILLLNYRDPFLDGYPGENLKKDNEIVQQPVEEIIRNEIIEEVYPDFQFKGIIRLGKSTQAMLVWNGENLMVGPKDKVGEFTILRITDEKLIVGWKNKKYELTIQ